MKSLLLLLSLSAALAETPTPKFTPPSAVEGSAEFKKTLKELNSLGHDRIDPSGGGPLRPGKDFDLASKLVEKATSTQLQQLLQVNNPALRANIVRAIALHRPRDLGLARILLSDTSPVTIGARSDTAPVKSERTTVKKITQEAIDFALASGVELKESKDSRN